MFNFGGVNKTGASGQVDKSGGNEQINALGVKNDARKGGIQADNKQEQLQQPSKLKSGNNELENDNKIIQSKPNVQVEQSKFQKFIAFFGGGNDNQSSSINLDNHHHVPKKAPFDENQHAVNLDDLPQKYLADPKKIKNSDPQLNPELMPKKIQRSEPELQIADKSSQKLQGLPPRPQGLEYDDESLDEVEGQEQHNPLLEENEQVEGQEQETGGNDHSLNLKINPNVQNIEHEMEEHEVEEQQQPLDKNKNFGDNLKSFEAIDDGILDDIVQNIGVKKEYHEQNIQNRPQGGLPAPNFNPGDDEQDEAELEGNTPQ